MAVCMLLAMVSAGCRSRHRAAPSFGGTASALEHLPADCDAVGRIDAAALFASDGVRQHVLEHAHSEADPRGIEGLAAFLKDSRLDVAKDVKEVVFCLADSGSVENGGGSRRAKFLVIVGGTLGHTDVLAGVLKYAPPERAFKERVVADKTVLARGDVRLGQLEDGAVVVSDSETLLIAAWPKGQRHHQEVKLPAAPIAMVANREVLSSIVPPGPLAPLAEAVAATQRLELTIALAPLDVAAIMETASPADGKRVGEFWEQVFVPFRNPATMRQMRERLPPLFTDVMQSGSAQTSGSRVQIRFQLPPQAIQSLYHSAAVLAAAR